MSIQLTNANISALANSAATPEEFAQQFLGLVTKGLAASIAEALDKTVSGTAAATASADKIKGWESLIGGASIQMCWERPKLGLPTGQVVAFAPRSAGLAPAGVGVSIGISITGTF